MSNILERVKKYVLERIRRRSFFSQNRGGQENRLAGSADFGNPGFKPQIVVIILSLLFYQYYYNIYINLYRQTTHCVVVCSIANISGSIDNNTNNTNNNNDDNNNNNNNNNNRDNIITTIWGLKPEFPKSADPAKRFSGPPRFWGTKDHALIRSKT